MHYTTFPIFPPSAVSHACYIACHVAAMPFIKYMLAKCTSPKAAGSSPCDMGFCTL